LLGASTNSPLLDQVRHNGRQSFIEQTGSGDAQHRLTASPAFWKLLFFSLRLGLFELGKGSILLCRTYRLIVSIGVRRKVVYKLSDRIADAAHLIFIERT